VKGLENERRVALLTIECQNSQTSPSTSSVASHQALASECERRAIVTRIRALAQLCRRLDLPVVHNRVAHREDWAGSTVNAPLFAVNRKQRKLIENTRDADLNSELGVQPTDFIVTRRNGVSPFYATGLDQILRSCGVQTVILTGVSTNLGIPGAAIEAVNRGYWVIVAEDCTAGATTEAHDYTVGQVLPLLGSVVSSEVLAAEMEARHGGIARF
jgi:nicotinamidase-related amidase